MTRPVRVMADISGHNRAWKRDPGAAFDALLSAGITDCYIKATEGRSYILDSMAEWSIIGRARGVDVGAYHFARPDVRPGDAEAEAAFFCERLRGLPLYLAPVLDIETAKDWAGTADGLAQWCLDWCRAVAATTGRYPIVYTGPGFWGSHLGRTQALNDLRLWVAAYPTVVPTSDRPPPKLGAWTPTAWQYTGSGTVPGIEGSIDLSFVYGDMT